MVSREAFIVWCWFRDQVEAQNSIQSDDTGCVEIYLFFKKREETRDGKNKCTDVILYTVYISCLHYICNVWPQLNGHCIKCVQISWYKWISTFFFLTNICIGPKNLVSVRLYLILLPYCSRDNEAYLYLSAVNNRDKPMISPG